MLSTASPSGELFSDEGNEYSNVATQYPPANSSTFNSKLASTPDDFSAANGTYMNLRPK